MINFVILLSFYIGSFLLLTIFRKRHSLFVLMAVAIGCGVNACVYSSYSTYAMLGKIYFGIESLLYSLFVYTLVVTVKFYDRKTFKNMALSTVVAILISGAIELFANASNCGEFTSEILIRFLSFVLSAIGTSIGVFAMRMTYKKLEKLHVNEYLRLIACSILILIINFVFVYGILAIIDYKMFPDFIWHFLGDVIAKAFCLILGCISYYVNCVWWKPEGKGE